MSRPFDPSGKRRRRPRAARRLEPGEDPGQRAPEHHGVQVHAVPAAGAGRPSAAHEPCRPPPATDAAGTPQRAPRTAPAAPGRGHRQRRRSPLHGARVLHTGLPTGGVPAQSEGKRAAQPARPAAQDGSAGRHRLVQPLGRGPDASADTPAAPTPPAHPPSPAATPASAEAQRRSRLVVFGARRSLRHGVMQWAHGVPVEIGKGQDFGAQTFDQEETELSSPSSAVCRQTST